FFSSRRRHTRFSRDWSSDVCSSDLPDHAAALGGQEHVVSAPGASEPPSQQLLALSALAAVSLPPAVAVSRVEEVSTGLDVPVEHLYGRIFVGDRSHDHAAERELAHLLASASKLHCLHAYFFCFSSVFASRRAR